LTHPPILVGVVTSAHGITGEVRVKSFTTDPVALGGYGPLTTADGRQLRIAALRHHRADELILRLDGVVTRGAAEQLKGCRLYVPRAVLPDPEPGEYYHADLVGLRAEDVSGGEVGRITAVLNYGAGDILEITAADGTAELIPFSDSHVPVVDLANGRVVVDVQWTEDEQGRNS
jgi:16S rRNA processing protein RimM